ncbi:MAG: hypothetical protein ACREH8_10490 [Opitutaceae bacterium]
MTRPIRSTRICALATLILGLFVGRCHGAAPEPAAPKLIDDRAITIRSAREVAAKRQALIHYIWGADGFPQQRLPDVVGKNVSSPVQHLSHLTRVDEFRFEQTPDLQGLAYHFIPQEPNRELVVLHHGHACTLDDDPSPAEVGYGLQRTIQALLREGHGVLGVFMPHKRPGDCRPGRIHDDLMATTTTGSPLKYFLDPVAISLNYLKTALLRTRNRSERYKYCVYNQGERRESLVDMENDRH